MYRWAGMEMRGSKIKPCFYVPLGKSLVLTDFEGLVHKRRD